MNSKRFIRAIRAHTKLLAVVILVNLLLIGAILLYLDGIRYVGPLNRPIVIHLVVLILLDAAITGIFIQTLMQENVEQNES